MPPAIQDFDAGRPSVLVWAGRVGFVPAEWCGFCWRGCGSLSGHFAGHCDRSVRGPTGCLGDREATE